MQRLTLRSFRLWLFIALLVAAPLSKYPSIALPLFDFTSFRLGLYQLLAALFVLVSIWPTFKARRELYRQNKYALVSIVMLALVCLLGLIGALYRARSGLLVASILLLLALLVTGWWYVSLELSKERYPALVRGLLLAGCVFGILSLVQFLLAGFGHQTLGILCNGCSSQVFGFPRINGLAAEPQFQANALLIYFFIGLGAFYRNRSRLALACMSLTAVGIGLTFSRGAFLAAGIGTLLFFVLLRLQGQLRLRTILKHTLILMSSAVLVVALFVAAASYRYRGTPDIAYKTFRSLVEQASLGVIELPKSMATSGGFQPEGLVEASGQERANAAELALRAWGHSPYTRMFGVGTGNLGPFVVAHLDSGAPDNLTVYIYYVLLLSELGIVGIVAFLGLSASTIKHYMERTWKRKDAALHTAGLCLLVAFLIQYCFFGSYINVAYVWLWFGILLGIASKPPEKRAIMTEDHEE
jgi:hypothetical protein